MSSELPEDIVGQGSNQKNATGEGFEPEKAGWRGENIDRSGAGVPASRTGDKGSKAGVPAGQASGVPSGAVARSAKAAAGQGGDPSSDPNRQPGGDGLSNESTEGNTFYDKNTEIRRESQFHDATATAVGNEDEKVTRDNDQFGK